MKTVCVTCGMCALAAEVWALQAGVCTESWKVEAVSLLSAGCHLPTALVCSCLCLGLYPAVCLQTSLSLSLSLLLWMFSISPWQTLLAQGDVLWIVSALNDLDFIALSVPLSGL